MGASPLYEILIFKKSGWKTILYTSSYEKYEKILAEWKDKIGEDNVKGITNF